MKTKRVRGYISAREIDGVIISHKVQNLVIREFCKNNNYLFLLSSVEYKMKNSFIILDEVLNELSSLDGVVMYSMFQAPMNNGKRKKIFEFILKKSKFICFALENIIIKNLNDLTKFEEVFKLNQILKYCPKKL